MDKFRTLDKTPDQDRKFYEFCRELILAANAISSSAIFRQLQDISSSSKLSYTSCKAMNYAAEAYVKNRRILEKGFTPETNNVMEQLFSFINDFTFACRSFKVKNGLRNWASNPFLFMNHRPFNTSLKSTDPERIWIISVEDLIKTFLRGPIACAIEITCSFRSIQKRSTCF